MTQQHGETAEVRRDDGELIGMLRQVADGGWVPCAVFGLPLATPRSAEAARGFLLDHGLGYLADRWEAREGGEWVTVQIVEARPER